MKNIAQFQIMYFVCQKYDKLLLAGDINLQETERNLSEFLSSWMQKFWFKVPKILVSNTP